MKIQLEKGLLSIAPEVFVALCGHCASNCFGVKGMASRSMTSRLLKKDSPASGVRVIQEDGEISIELHIVVEHGINIAEVCRSIMHEVRYTIEQLTGLKVKNVDICVDAIVAN